MILKNLNLTALLLIGCTLFSCGEGKATSEVGSGNQTPPKEKPTEPGKDNEGKTEVDGSEIIVDMSAKGGPDINYMRGAQGPGQSGFYDGSDMRECLKVHASKGMKIFNGTRRLASDGQSGDFYIDNGERATKQIDAYVNIKKYAHTLGYELICMMDGTPAWAIEVEKETFHWGTPNFQMVDYKLANDDAPLPKEGKPMEDYQRLFVKFAKESDAAVAPNCNSIWIGTQEIAHTIGFRDGVKTIETKKEAIRRYIDFWKPIAESLSEAGKRVGGIQLNSSNANDGGSHDLYDYAVDQMVVKNLKLDYLTFQFYQWGTELPMIRAAASVRKYQEEMNMPQTRLIIDRGAYGKITDENKTSCGKFITFLQGEKYCMNQADVVYAYTLDCGVGSFVRSDQHNVEWQTKYWMHKLGDKRRPIENLPKGIDGFMTTRDGELYGIIWNSDIEGVNTQKVDFYLKNAQATYNNKPQIWKGSGEKLTKVECAFNNNIISGLSLNSDEYLLIQLNK